MDITCEGFTCPKDGASDAQNDDALIPQGRTSNAFAFFRCAVADGATESLFAGKWADRLVGAFHRGRLSSSNHSTHLRRLQAGWSRFLAAQPLEWYAEPKAVIGSFATLVGLELYAQSSPGKADARWAARALGDSCLFLVRNDALIKALPLDAPDGFNNQPHLFASNPKFNKHLVDWFTPSEGDLRTGDRFYLMTDALSFWFLNQHANGNRPWQLLPDFHGNRATFNEWVFALRCNDDRMNDDATLLRVEVESVE